MRLRISIQMDNAAFVDYPDEVQRILGKIGIEQIRQGKKDGRTHLLRDTNGNTVGAYVVLRGAAG